MSDVQLTLRSITAENWQECAALRVREGQRSYVPPNLESLAAAKFYPDNVCRGLYVGDRMVGFALYGIEQASGRVKLFRLMIDGEKQRRGYGSAAMAALLAEMEDRWQPQAIYVSYQDDNAVARRLYASYAFREIEREGRKITARREGSVKSAAAIRPTLIVVTGRPGAGKSTLAHALARAVRCPAVCRDEIKEGLINTTGATDGGGDDAARQVYEVFFDTIKSLLSRRITLVAEAAFQHKRSAPELEPMLTLADIRIVVCNVDAQRARARQIERTSADPKRERFHSIPPPGADAEYDPPRLEVPTLTVDTSDGYQPALEDIVAFISRRR